MSNSEQSPGDKNAGIYVASRVSRAEMWRGYRDEGGVPIVSTWIDEAGDGETDDFGLEDVGNK